jgi:tetratricopeptide (TPR) repeat protein
MQLALTMLVVQYILVIGGTFGASIIFSAQRLNLIGSAGLGLGWLVVRLMQRRRVTLMGLEWPMLILVASQWLAVITSTQPRLGLDWAASLTTWMVCFLILADLIANSWPRSFWLNALVVAAVIVVADCVWSTTQWIAGWAALGTLPPVTFRYYGLLGQANLAACVINLLGPIVVARLAQAGQFAARLTLGALIAGLAATSFLTSSRAGWLAAAVALVVLVAMSAYARGAQTWVRDLRSGWLRSHAAVRLATIGGVLLALAAAAWLLLKQSRQITHASLFESRGLFWSAAWDLFKSRPLTGVGPDLYAWYYSRYASIPPDFFAPHAHSVIMQILSGSGVLGIGALLLFAGACTIRLWQRWEASSRAFEMACIIVALLSFAVHLLFDFPVTPITMLLLVILLALALSPVSTAETPRSIHPILAAPLLLLPIGVFAFLLQGSASNDVALKLAAQGQWHDAAQVFVQTAKADPQLTLYWEEAAYAYTQAGDIQAALPLWERAARDDPYWAVLPGTIGALTQDLPVAQAARARAPRSYLFALNAGNIAEAQGNAPVAQEAYQSALTLKPAIADTLFWQQTPLRSSVLEAWRNSLPTDDSALAKGWNALAVHVPDQAIGWFRQAVTVDPNSLVAYLGLGKAFLQLGDLMSAQRAVATGLNLPVTSFEESLPLHLLAGEVDDAHGDRAGATAEFSIVFNGIADYDINGPGSYGHPERAWQVFHREALPGELVPQLPRADITSDMDQRFAQLAQWYREDRQPTLACWILQRVYREAPQSVSGGLYGQECHAT